MRRFAPVTLILSCFLAHAQTRVTHSPAPAWAAPYAYTHETSDSSGTSNGYLYLLVSMQNNLETKEHYRKYAIKVISEQGLSVASSINESFDPSFQRIYFHTLNIIRGGRTINKMDAGRFEVIRREEEMDRAVYDKTLSAVYNLPDVRVGDIVEYSFTIKGANPAFGDHVFGNLYLQYSVPVAKFAHRILFNPDRPIQFKAYGDAGTPEQAEAGKMKCHEWVRENIPALLTDDMMPSWYDPYAHVQYSDFQSWHEVKSWAYKIFQMKEPASARLRDLVKKITTMPVSDEEKIKECIRIVQADIRYLSFSDGIHSYKPHAPDLVFDQKYGDCKDKSLLLSYLLNKAGIESYPSLVSTENGEILNDILPNPWAFNHCIVQFNFKDSTYWIDPTLRPQVGALKNYYFPSYKNALVVSSGTGGLDSIPFGYKNSRIDVLEKYSMVEVGGDVTLKVQTSFYGDEADEIRNYMQSNTREEIHKNYLNFYAKDYSEISLNKDVEFEDNKAENVITSTEEYLIRNFWNLDPETGKTGLLYARVLSSYLRLPDTKLRTMPLAIKHPVEINQTIKIYVPEEWGIEEFQREIESDGFEYRASASYHEKVITLRYAYKTKASFVEAESTADHIDKLDEVFNNISYMIYKPLKKEDDVNSKAIVMLVILAGIGIYVARRRYR